MKITAVKQRGATLLVSLIMLVILTMFALSAINLTNVNLRISGNMQVQQESQAAAQQSIDHVLKSPFVVTATSETVPDVVIGGSTYKPTVTKQCIDSKVSKDSDPTVLVYDSVWEVRAEVADTRTGAKTVVHQGVSLAAGGACP